MCTGEYVCPCPCFPTEAQVFELDVTKEYAEVHVNSLVPCENMVKMSELSEAAILHNLRLRYKENDIYVRVDTVICRWCVCMCL